VEHGDGQPDDSGPGADTLRARVLSVLRESVRNRIFPGAVAALISRTNETYFCVGSETYDPDARPVLETSIFDVASLTKVLATTTAIMQLVERGQLSLHDRACKFLPQLGMPPKDRITILQLLAHTAGFPGGEPLRPCTSRDEILQAIYCMELLYAPGSDRVYDDLGFILLGLIVEVVTGVTLDRHCDSEIFAPLEMSETMFAPPGTLVERIVPTEIDAARGGLLRGLVHDQTAHKLGGVAGHAGLFTTARDLGRFARFVMRQHGERHERTAPAGILSSASVRLMWSRHWQDAQGDYGLGWDRLRPSYMDGIDDRDAVGHTRFTGVSLVISPRRDLAMILLSNRVHPRRSDSTQINLARCRFVDAALQSS
jgi:CubicO group peptidase (beta-lactamase class C family)